jgi:hypothetical protein
MAASHAITRRALRTYAPAKSNPRRPTCTRIVPTVEVMASAFRMYASTPATRRTWSEPGRT